MDNAGGTGLHLLLYEANFETTWNEVLNSGADGTYTVTFRAKSADGSWIGGAAGTREFVIRSTAKEGEYCYRLDLAPLNGSSPLDVSLSAEAGLPADPETVSYEWNLDLNCDGTVDGGSGSSSEVFTTPADSSEITRTFTIDPDEGESASCAASVSVIVNDETLDELSDGSCTGTVHVSQTTDTCGNGSCETNETCDPDGNISCPANTALPAGTTCSDACFYCGDGYLNTGEQCDPGIPSDESGYEENCQEDCTISSGSPSPGDDSSPAGDEGDATATGTFVITQDIPKCLEMVAPHNTVPITVTITNNDTTGTTVRAISDSLPRGLTYTAGSSSINSAQNTQDNGVLVETTGSSQLVTWDNAGQGWTIVSGGTLTLSFTATVGSSATVGTQTNTITVTPADENPVPSESPVLIAQTCTQPLTGIFDRNVLYILTGLLFLLIAGTAYYTGFGTTEVAHLLDRSTTAWKNTYLHMTQPQKYMEEQVKNSALKKIHQHTDAKTKRPRQR